MEGVESPFWFWVRMQTRERGVREGQGGKKEGGKERGSEKGDEENKGLWMRITRGGQPRYLFLLMLAHYSFPRAAKFNNDNGYVVL
jgi:hypothetical protein